jgi:hypothetical protein
MKPTEAELREILVYAPIGLASVCAETVLPILKEEAANLRQQVPAARFIGQMAAQQVQNQLRSRGDIGREQLDTVIGLGNSVMTKIVEWSGCRPQGSDSGSHSPTAPTATAESDTPLISQADDLSESEPMVLMSIEGYDNLSALQIISLLDDLRPQDLEEVAAYEAAHRQRRTILNRIRQLREG